MGVVQCVVLVLLWLNFVPCAFTLDSRFDCTAYQLPTNITLKWRPPGWNPIAPVLEQDQEQEIGAIWRSWESFFTKGDFVIGKERHLFRHLHDDEGDLALEDCNFDLLGTVVLVNDKTLADLGTGTEWYFYHLLDANDNILGTLDVYRAVSPSTAGRDFTWRLNTSEQCVLSSGSSIWKNAADYWPIVLQECQSNYTGLLLELMITTVAGNWMIAETSIPVTALVAILSTIGTTIVAYLCIYTIFKPLLEWRERRAAQSELSLSLPRAVWYQDFLMGKPLPEQPTETTIDERTWNDVGKKLLVYVTLADGQVPNSPLHRTEGYVDLTDWRRSTPITTAQVVGKMFKLQPLSPGLRLFQLLSENRRHRLSGKTLGQCIRKYDELVLDDVPVDLEQQTPNRLLVTIFFLHTGKVHKVDLSNRLEESPRRVAERIATLFHVPHPSTMWLHTRVVDIDGVEGEEEGKLIVLEGERLGACVNAGEELVLGPAGTAVVQQPLVDVL